LNRLIALGHRVAVCEQIEDPAEARKRGPKAVVRRDVELAQKVMASDDQVDHYRDQIFRELLTYMMGDSSLVFPAFELILVAKNLERIGDHATNIAEDVIYIVQGQDIRHPSIDRR